MAQDPDFTVSASYAMAAFLAARAHGDGGRGHERRATERIEQLVAADRERSRPIESFKLDHHGLSAPLLADARAAILDLPVHVAGVARVKVEVLPDEPLHVVVLGVAPGLHAAAARQVAARFMDACRPHLRGVTDVRCMWYVEGAGPPPIALRRIRRVRGFDDLTCRRGELSDAA
jgi:hypothetical protein